MAADAAEAADVADEIAFTALDVLGGFARLTKRSPTFDGAVPLRVAQGCVPLLQGNAYGFQVTLTREVRVRRGFAGLKIQADLESVERERFANVPRLYALGLLDRNDPRAPSVQSVVSVGKNSRIRLFTGLLLKPEPGVLLRVTSAANRRNTSIEVDEEWIPAAAGFVPLVLSIHVPGEATLLGEVACVGPLQAGVGIRRRALRDAPEVAEAHVTFYDQAYFDTKKSEVSLKYRRQVAHEKPPPTKTTVVSAEIVEAGPVDWSVVAAGPFTKAPEGSAPLLDSAVFRSPFTFTALFDGHTLAIDVDKDQVAKAAVAVKHTFKEAMGAQDFLSLHRGALWYLTKFFTPHPPGDPHFFVKPWAFTRTPVGWSSVLDGIHGDGYDILRGVVSTDSFFATPAVFRVIREGSAIHILKGQPLLRVIPAPRGLLQAGFRTESLAPI